MTSANIDRSTEKALMDILLSGMSGPHWHDHPNHEAVMGVLSELKIDHDGDARPGQVRVWFEGSDVGMSIITRTYAIDGAFCESALFRANPDKTVHTAEVIYINHLGYHDVLRFESAAELKEHLIEMTKEITGHSIAELSTR